MKAILFSFITLITCSISAADNDVAKEKYDQALALYEQRATAGKVEQAATLLAAAITDAEDKDLKYDILLLHAKSLYWKGIHTAEKAQKLAILLSAKQKSDTAKQLEEDYAEAFYWSAASLGRWAQTKGPFSSLSKKGEMMDLLEAVLDKDTKDGDLGEEYAGYGADRILGRLYLKLPSLAGGSTAKAIRHGGRAYRRAPKHALNAIYYAEALYSTGEGPKKAQARKILDDLLKENPRTLAPHRIPETLEEFELARKVRSEMGQ